LDEHDQFSVPYGGRFKLNSRERCVEPIQPQVPVAAPTSSSSFAEEVLRQALGPTVLGTVMRPDNYGFVMQFEDMEKLQAAVPKIAELSRKMQDLGERTQYVVMMSKATGRGEL